MSKMVRGLWFAGVASLAAGLSFSGAAIAQDDSDDDDADASYNIIVTGTSVRQGGAQDISHFRSVSLDGDFLPPSDSLTLEGLLGEHDLTLPRREACAQMFCLVGHSMDAAIPSRPQDLYFAGLDFDSNIDAEKWKGEPLSLIAVVDRSGSMSGQPMDRVKAALRAVLDQLGKGDRMGIVIYGSDTEVRLPVTDVAGHRDDIARAIAGIDINGSTYMEAGLKLGYQAAFDELARSNGKTRLMLFTDEQPNVGNTSAEGFMGLARAGSEKGVGLTTVGVGVHYDGELASEVASARGGNLFFIDSDAAADKLFAREFRNMTSEVAHDIAITMTPPEGYAITGVFGVPAANMETRQDGAVSVTIGTAFLSSNGGGIYVSLGRDAAHDYLPAVALDLSAPLLTVDLSYVDAITGETGRDRIAVPHPAGAAPEGLGTAQVLVDEYLTLQLALDTYHQQGDEKGAFSLLDGLSTRLGGLEMAGLDNERELIGGLRDRAGYMAGYLGEMPAELRPLALIGEWKVASLAGVGGLYRGDTVELTEDGEFVTWPKNPKREESYQDFEVNEKQIRIFEEDREAATDFRYSLNGDRLTLRSRDGDVRLALVRVE